MSNAEPNRLFSLEEVDGWKKYGKTTGEVQLAFQLADIMRENERLLAIINSMKIDPEIYIQEFYDQDCPICGFQPKRVNDRIDEALSSKESDNG